jgi:endonuclease III
MAAALAGPLKGAKRALRRFPGIGEPGAEKILLFAGRAAPLALESNGLRVLVRLGLVREESSYTRTWAGSRDLGARLGDDPRRVEEAHLLLKRHGETLCRSSRPRCDECPLRARCAFAAAEARG